MAFTKITTSDLNSRGATTLPNQPKISATALKQEFDAPAKNVVAPKVNNLIDELEATSAAASLGATAPTGRSGNTVQAVMNKLSTDLKTVEDGMSEAIQDAHTHNNKALLDTYTQTEADLASAVQDDHTHSNKGLLDSYTQSEEDLADAVSKAHEHDNKDLLDTYDQSNEDIADAISNTHSHDNKALLDTYEQTEANLADAVDKKHTHSNKSVLDKFGESSGEPTYDGNPIGGGTSDYESLSNQPQINSVTLTGNKSLSDLGIATSLAGLTDDSTHRVVTDTEKSAWSGKVDNAYKKVKVGSTEITASSEDTIEFVAGNNVTLTPDATNKTVTIESTGGGSGGTDANAYHKGDTAETTLADDDYVPFYDTSATATRKSLWSNIKSVLKTYFDTVYIKLSQTTGLVKNDGTIDTNTYLTSTDIADKANKVSGGTSGNFAGLDSNGDLTDSGKKASDFLGATDIEANPSGSATGSLSKLRIGSSIYSVEGGGGKTIVQIPSVVGDSFTYDGTAQGATITGLDTTHCTVVGGTGTTVTTSGDTTYVKATDAGSYSFTVELNDPTSMVWSDLTTADKSYSFTIAKAPQTLTASKNSVSLTTQQPSDMVTISGQQGSLNVSSSATGVATVSESSGVVTITGVATGNATISVYAEETANYAQSATITINATVVLGQLVTIYSAANDTVSFTDAAGSKTVTTDSSGVGTVAIVIQGGSQSITFTSSVAKNPSSLSQAYSKTVTIGANTTEVYVMPDDVCYWFGYKSSDYEVCSIANGWDSGVDYVAPTEYTNYVLCDAPALDTKHKWSVIAFKTAMTVTNSILIYEGSRKSGDIYGFFGYNSSKKTADADQSNLTSASLSVEVRQSVTNKYIFAGAANNRAVKIFALCANYGGGS